MREKNKKSKSFKTKNKKAKIKDEVINDVIIVCENTSLDSSCHWVGKRSTMKSTNAVTHKKSTNHVQVKWSSNKSHLVPNDPHQQPSKQSLLSVSCSSHSTLTKASLHGTTLKEASLWMIQEWGIHHNIENLRKKPLQMSFKKSVQNEIESVDEDFLFVISFWCFCNSCLCVSFISLSKVGIG